MNQKPRHKHLLAVTLAVLLPLLVVTAHAEAYRFEMVVFERPDAAPGADTGEISDPPDSANSAGALRRFAVGGRTLGGVAYTLKKKGMIVHEHIAWVQTPRGRNSKAWYDIGSGRLSGLVRVTRGRFLHIDADLYLRDADTAQPLRAMLYRRMRSDELHYLDHPKLGIVIRADRVVTQSEPDDTDAAAGEPKPAVPAGRPQPG